MSSSSGRGTPIPASYLHHRVWKPTLENAELAEHGYRWHDLRHTCVSRLVAAGADVRLVQAVAGHANPVITLKRYTHLRDARVSEAAERFDPVAVS
jgi:integrase